MKKIFKPASLLLYLLTLILFFVIGASIVRVTGVAEGHGLAGGAIVFYYGVIGSFLGIVLAIFISYKSKLKTVININKILSILLLTLVVLGSYRLLDLNKKKEKQKEEIPTRTIEPTSKELAFLSYS